MRNVIWFGVVRELITPKKDVVDLATSLAIKTN